MHISLHKMSSICLTETYNKKAVTYVYGCKKACCKLNLFYYNIIISRKFFEYFKINIDIAYRRLL